MASVIVADAYARGSLPGNFTFVFRRKSHRLDNTIIGSVHYFGSVDITHQKKMNTKQLCISWSGRRIGFRNRFSWNTTPRSVGANATQKCLSYLPNELLNLAMQNKLPLLFFKHCEIQKCSAMLNRNTCAKFRQQFNDIIHQPKRTRSCFHELVKPEETGFLCHIFHNFQQPMQTTLRTWSCFVFGLKQKHCLTRILEASDPCANKNLLISMFAWITGNWNDDVGPSILNKTEFIPDETMWQHEQINTSGPSHV